MRRVTFANVLIGIDGRHGGRDAIALAKTLAASHATLTLAHVDTGGPVSWWAHELGEERVFDREVSMLAAERERASLDAGIVCVRDASPAAGLHELAKNRTADLIVVGSSRHALLGRVLLGDDARAALDGAPCAIAVAPSGYTERAHSLAEIGVGYDGSGESERALAVARELADPTGARVTALMIDGEPREELARLSKTVDLLVVGSRCEGPLVRSVHGSISRHLVGRVACPLLVPAPGRDRGSSRFAVSRGDDAGFRSYPAPRASLPG